MLPRRSFAGGRNKDWIVVSIAVMGGDLNGPLYVDMDMAGPATALLSEAVTAVIFLPAPATGMSGLMVDGFFADARK
jgi:hypothetical protein